MTKKNLSPKEQYIVGIYRQTNDIHKTIIEILEFSDCMAKIGMKKGKDENEAIKFIRKTCKKYDSSRR